ncbi:sarcoplasmic calcium-binding protein [Toxorhynchites rutilus septentrionalis]|uniref:sarcoplasmic calcium-binding protein n=1 Tax=Toxorhynchites rutilus septentrionalis TaxID=329112 RepID=UPI00247A7B78|nr:sarcoplasmic calcium-binding protein [Toxorhynchites rutilus septentrionalis]
MAFALLINCARLSLPLVERNIASLTVANANSDTLFIKEKLNHAAFGKLAPCFVTVSVREYSKKSNRSERAYDGDSDSDDEKERKSPESREKGSTEFWRRKMRTLHGLLDVNNDGVISYDDFKLLTEKFESLGHLNKEATEEFRDIMKTTWTQLFGEITPYNLITVEQYLGEMHHVVNDKDLRKKAHRFLPYLYKAVDKDHSKSISLNEFKLFFRCLGLTDEDAAVSFAVIDSNGDGQITLNEFVKLGRDFFLTENETNVSRLFWGPLVEH